MEKGGFGRQWGAGFTMIPRTHRHINKGSQKLPYSLGVIERQPRCGAALFLVMYFGAKTTRALSPGPPYNTYTSLNFSSLFFVVSINKKKYKNTHSQAAVSGQKYMYHVPPP